MILNILLTHSKLHIVNVHELWPLRQFCLTLLLCFVIQQVKDRTVIQTTDAERKTTAPDWLQSAIDELVAQYKKARSFVRYVALYMRVLIKAWLV